jgi:hypothetical protein
VDRSVLCNQDGCSFRNFYFILFFPHGAWSSFLSGTGTARKETQETKGPGRRRNWNSLRMLGPQNLCRQICVPSLNRGWESWTAFSLRNYHLAPVEWEEVVSQPWRSLKTTSPHRILTGTCAILWSPGFWKVSVLCNFCLF